MVVSYCVSIGNQSRVFCETGECSELPGRFSRFEGDFVSLKCLLVLLCVHSGLCV